MSLEQLQEVTALFSSLGGDAKQLIVWWFAISFSLTVIGYVFAAFVIWFVARTIFRLASPVIMAYRMGHMLGFTGPHDGHRQQQIMDTFKKGLEK